MAWAKGFRRPFYATNLGVGNGESSVSVCFRVFGNQETSIELKQALTICGLTNRKNGTLARLMSIEKQGVWDSATKNTFY